MNLRQQTGVIGVVWGCLVAAGACRMAPNPSPLPTGPSEFALSMALTATPDVIRQDGASHSTVQVWARDAAALPVRGIQLRLETWANGQLVDFGVLSSRTLTTGPDGKASATYVAPAPPPPTAQSDVLVTIRAVPVGTNYANAQSRTVDIRLTRPGVILPPNGTPQPAFFLSPTTPAEEEAVFFDAGASRDDGEIVSYLWQFGEGSQGTGRLAHHSYALAGTFQVTLTVVDDLGLRASTSPMPVTVRPAPNPVAAFTISPTNPQVGSSVVFNAATSTVPTGRRIVAWHWEFGDGHQAEGVAPVHVFSVAQVHTVVLTVTDNTGRQGVTTQAIEVVLPAEWPSGLIAPGLAQYW